MNITALARVGVESIRGYWQGPVPLRDPNLASYFNWPGASTYAGVSVTEQNALTYSAVWNAVSLITSQVASLPLNLYVNSTAGKSIMERNPLHYLLHDEPNSEMSSFEFRETLQQHLLLWGNAYAEIVRNGRGAVSALWPLTPNRVQPVRDTVRVNGREQYGPLQYRIDGEQIVGADRILHLRGLAFDGCVGYGPISCARQSIALGIAAEQFGATFYGNGSTFGGILTHPGKLTKDAKQAIRETIQERHQGPNKAHQFLILGEGMKYEKLGIPPDDAQFLESRKFQVTEVCRWFNIPPHKLKDLERATFSNIEQQSIEFVNDCLRPWLTRWEQSLNRALIPSLERGIQAFKFNVNGLLRGDTAARATYYSQMFNIGSLSANDIREFEDLNGIGPDGDQYFVQGALIPIDQVQAKIEADMRPQPAPAAPDPNPQRAIEDEETHRQREQALESLRTIMEKLGAVEAGQALTAESLKVLPAAVRDELAPAITEGSQIASAATARAEQAEARAREAAADLGRAEQGLAAAEAARIDAERRVSEAEAAVRSAEGRAVMGEQTAEERAAGVAAAERDRDDARAALEIARAERDQAVENAQRARGETEAAQTEAARLESARAEARAEADERAARVVEFQAQVEAFRQASESHKQEWAELRKAQLSRMLTVHRGLIVDAMGRMVRRETEKARRNQGTPSKLRAWAEGFYLFHEDTCVDAILPAVRTHLAWKGSEDDADVVARGWLRPHLAAAVQQIRAIADGDPEDFQISLERVLTKWEQERPDALADQVLREEIDHVRNL